MPVEFKDYYATMGVPRTANEDDIKKAFRKLARKYHPDVAKDKKASEEKFKELNEAYEVLSDPQKRRKYDQLGADWKNGSSARQGSQRNSSDGKRSYEFHFGGTGFSDFFEQFFGGSRHEDFEDILRGATGQRGSFESSPQRGGDIEGDILVTLKEVQHGSVRSISLQRPSRGAGSETQTFKVKVPPGVQEGQIIRVQGKGGEGARGGASGDLYLRVRLAAHPEFRVKASDLYYDLDVAPWEAVLGATIDVPTLEGNVRLRIPAGTNNGHRLRLQGRGLLRGSHGDRGDLFVMVRIQLPSKLSEEERSLWEKLSRASSFNPRHSAVSN